MNFNKGFILPEGKALEDYIVINIEGKDTTHFYVDVTEVENTSRRNLA